MTLLKNAHSAYNDTSVPTKTDRSLEYDTVARVTASMKAATTGTNNFERIVRATNDNRRLWNFIAASVADNENMLPKQLRAQLFFLAEFVSLHTKKVLKKEAEILPLIDINISIMRGLNMVKDT